MTVRSDGVGFRSERGPILIALMLTSGLVAINSTILATAVPTIVDDLGGFSQFPDCSPFTCWHRRSRFRSTRSSPT
jgi:hypothetical protein